MTPEEIIAVIRNCPVHDDNHDVPGWAARDLCDAYEALRSKYRQVMDAARVNEDAPTVSGYDPSGDERTVSLRWPSGNLHCYDRTDMRTVDLMEAEIDALKDKMKWEDKITSAVNSANEILRKENINLRAKVEGLEKDLEATTRRGTELGHMLMGKVFDRDKEIHELRSKVQDAMRYQWLRDPGRLVGACDDHIIVASAGGEDVLYAQSLDAAIDAAMQKEQAGGV